MIRGSGSPHWGRILFSFCRIACFGVVFFRSPAGVLPSRWFGRSGLVSDAPAWASYGPESLSPSAPPSAGLVRRGFRVRLLIAHCRKRKAVQRGIKSGVDVIARTVFGEAWRGRSGGPARPAKTISGEAWRSRQAAQRAQPRPSSASRGEAASVAQPAQPRLIPARRCEVARRPSPPSQYRLRRGMARPPGAPVRPAKTVFCEASRNRFGGPARSAETVFGESWQGRFGGPARPAKIDSGEALRGCPAAQPAQPGPSSESLRTYVAGAFAEGFQGP